MERTILPADYFETFQEPTGWFPGRFWLSRTMSPTLRNGFPAALSPPEEPGHTEKKLNKIRKSWILYISNYKRPWSKKWTTLTPSDFFCLKTIFLGTLIMEPPFFKSAIISKKARVYLSRLYLLWWSLVELPLEALDLQPKLVHGWMSPRSSH